MSDSRKRRKRIALERKLAGEAVQLLAAMHGKLPEFVRVSVCGQPRPVLEGLQKHLERLVRSLRPNETLDVSIDGGPRADIRAVVSNGTILTSYNPLHEDPEP